jgi:hypothetical protein
MGDRTTGGQAMGEQARHDLTRAIALEPQERYRVALSVAVRAAALVLAERTHPSTIRRGPTGIWVLLARHAPALREWSDFFVLAATRTFGPRQSPVSEREADDLLRDAGRFLDVALNLSSPHRSAI